MSKTLENHQDFLTAARAAMTKVLQARRAKDKPATADEAQQIKIALADAGFVLTRKGGSRAIDE